MCSLGCELWPTCPSSPHHARASHRAEAMCRPCSQQSHCIAYPLLLQSGELELQALQKGLCHVYRSIADHRLLTIRLCRGVGISPFAVSHAFAMTQGRWSENISSVHNTALQFVYIALSWLQAHFLRPSCLASLALLCARTSDLCTPSSRRCSGRRRRMLTCMALRPCWLTCASARLPLRPFRCVCGMAQLLLLPVCPLMCTSGTSF